MWIFSKPEILKPLNSWNNTFKFCMNKTIFKDITIKQLCVLCCMPCKKCLLNIVHANYFRFCVGLNKDDFSKLWEFDISTG